MSLDSTFSSSAVVTNYLQIIVAYTWNMNCLLMVLSAVLIVSCQPGKDRPPAESKRLRDQVIFKLLQLAHDVHLHSISQFWNSGGGGMHISLRGQRESLRTITHISQEKHGLMHPRGRPRHLWAAHASLCFWEPKSADSFSPLTSSLQLSNLGCASFLST